MDPYLEQSTSPTHAPGGQRAWSKAREIGNQIVSMPELGRAKPPQSSAMTTLNKANLNDRLYQ